MCNKIEKCTKDVNFELERKFITENEINIFFDRIHINKNLRNTSLNFLNLIIENVVKYIPWQNITMIDNGLGQIPTFEDIKKNALRKWRYLS